MIHEWLKIPYKAYGRDATGCDCWGLVRIARHAIRGDLLPSFGAIDPDNKAELTNAAFRVIVQSGFKSQKEIKPGAIVTVWRGAICFHVAIVVEADGRFAVLETGSKSGARWFRMSDFERLYADVRIYDN